MLCITHCGGRRFESAGLPIEAPGNSSLPTDTAAVAQPSALMPTDSAGALASSPSADPAMTSSDSASIPNDVDAHVGDAATSPPGVDADGAPIPTATASSVLMPDNDAAASDIDAATDSAPANSAVDADISSDATVCEGASCTPMPCAPPAVLSGAGVCYFFSEEQVDWDTAHTSCVNRGAGWDLLQIHSLTEHEFITPLLTGQTWLGATDMQVADEWVWLNEPSPFYIGRTGDGAAVGDAFVLWADGQPSGTIESEQCARYVDDDNGQWNWADTPCGREYVYICELRSQ